MKKGEKYKLNKLLKKKKIKTIYKNGQKNIIKFDDIEIEEYIFHQHESPIPINNIDIN